MGLRNLMIMALVLGSAPALAQDPHVMWRAAGSGTLAVDPLATPANTNDDSQPPVVPAPPHLEIDGPDTIVLRIGQQHRVSPFETRNARDPVTWELKGGLPYGILLDLDSGEIMGVPVPGSAGTYVVELVARDSEGYAASRVLEINVIE